MKPGTTSTDPMSDQKAFRILRPFCVKVAEHPSVESVNRLEQELAKIDHKDLQIIQEYVIFPIKLALLRDGRQENVTIALVNCLRALLSMTEVNNWQLFMDLFLKLFLLISSKETEIKVRECSEDLKLAVVECLKCLVEQTPNDVKKSLYEATFCPALGHGVYILIQLSQNESLRLLRVASMKTINLIFGLTSDLSSKPDSNTSALVQSRLAAFLPGICIAMHQISTADTKQGHAVTVAALETWASVVVFCLSSPEDEEKSQDAVASVNGKPRVPEVKRTREWIMSTASKLQILLKRMLQLVSHPHHRVRLTLANLVGLLLLNCRSSFQDSFVALSECVISLMSDDMESVCKRSKKIIAKLSSQDFEGPLVDTLEDSVYSLATRLPRLLRNTDEKEKLVALNLLSGYVTILDRRTESLVRSSSHLKRLMQALVHISQPDTRNVPLVLPSVGMEGSSCLKFQHFTDSCVLASLKQSCSLLGQYGDISVIVDCLLDIIQINNAHCEGAVFVLNLVSSGAAQKQQLDPESKDAIKHAFDVYMNPWLWEDERKVVLKSLLLEGIVRFVQILDDDSRSFHVEDLLCLFLEQAGVNSSWVVQAAKTSLDSLSRIQKHSSVDELIYSNTDYLVHSLSMKLVHFAEYPTLPSLLKVLFTSVNQNNLLLFHDIIQRILTVIDAVYGSKKAGEFLSVLLSLVKVISSYFPSSSASQEIQISCELPETSQTLKDLIVNRQNNLLASKRLEEEDGNDDRNRIQDNELATEMTDESLQTNDKPLHIQVTCQILKRCGHLLRVNDLWAVLTTLDVIQSGLTILADHEDDILPMVHELWTPFKDLFQSHCSPVVIAKAFETLLLMAKICKSFIRKRTIDCVWPQLLQVLEKQAQLSMRKENSTQQMNKLIVLLLSELGKLACLLELQGSDLERICHICLSFLKVDTRPPVIKACSETLSWLQKLDPDAVWWWLTRVSGVSTNIPTAPGPEFRTVLLPPIKLYPENSVTFLQELLQNKENT